MDKIAPTAYDIHPLLANRWSPRAFAPQPVEPTKLRQLFEAARWSASCFNDQPWIYIVGTQSGDPNDSQTYTRLLDCLVPANVTWAQRAPVLAVAIAQNQFKHNGKPNMWGSYDLGQSAALMSIQAVHLGLIMHQMGGFTADKVRSHFQLPETVTPMAMIAIGYAADPATLSDDWREKELSPRTRYPQQSFVYGGEWGQAAPFLAEGG